MSWSYPVADRVRQTMTCRRPSLAMSGRVSPLSALNVPITVGRATASEKSRNADASRRAATTAPPLDCAEEVRIEQWQLVKGSADVPALIESRHVNAFDSFGVRHAPGDGCAGAIGGHCHRGPHYVPRRETGGNRS